MVHVHGRDVAARVATIEKIEPLKRLLVPIDVGKHDAMALVADATGERLVAPFSFTLDRPGLADLVRRVERVVGRRRARRVEVGVEAAGHYHRPVTASGRLPSSWELVELNPGHVTEQRRVLGKRGIKTDQVDSPRCTTCCWPAAAARSTAMWRCSTSCGRGLGFVTAASVR